MNFNRVLITGSGGMLGEAVYEVFSAKYTNVLATDIDLTEPWLEHMDIRKMKECEMVFTQFKPDLVLNLAALTDLEYCEKEVHDCWLTNALGVENIALLCDKYNATMVHISTAGVFDGKKDIYHDFDQPMPLNEYGKSKYYSEQFLERRLKKYFIFRAGWMMGGGVKKDKKFINKIYKQLKAGAKELYVVDDKLGTPTYTKNFAESICKIVQTQYYGLYNQVCRGTCSRFDVAVKLIDFLGLSNEIKLNRVDSDYFKTEYFAPRPYSEKLINLKLDSRGINFMLNWEECLKEYAQIFVADLRSNS